MKTIKSFYLIFSLLLFVVLAACSQTPTAPLPSEKALFNDADLDKAKLIKSQEVLVKAKLRA